jgi:glutathione S-transferase
MSDLILHHYEASPFSEKARLVLGVKGLAWKSVRIPAVMPKPDVIALTGGYRKTPILQIGNHIYCDTALMTRVIEALHPTPPLLRDPHAIVIGEWADTELFLNAVTLSRRPTRFDLIMTMMEQDELVRMRDDRTAMGDGARRMPPPFATAKSQMPILLGRLEAMLGDKPFLCGDKPTIADLCAFHPLYLVDILTTEYLGGFDKVSAWRQRIAAIGHGTHESITSGDAIDICRNAKPAALPTEADPNGPAIGSTVRVSACDLGREATEGTVVLVGENEIALRRHDERAGEVIVHFPRYGYDVVPV